MTRILVNDHEHCATASPQTWGELLAALDGSELANGQVVTAARFDGVEEPAFREREAMDRDLSSTSVVEVRTDDALTLIEQALAEASTALEQLCRATTEVADRFRGHNLIAAHQGLVELAEGLRMLMSITSTTAAALGASLDTLVVREASASTLIAQLKQYLDALITAQQTHDWVTAADIFEYDLEPALREWSEIIDALRQMASTLREARG